MANVITLKYSTTEFCLPRDCITREDVATLFGLKETGIHIKVQMSGNWVKVLPALNGSFEFDELCGNLGYVVSFVNYLIHFDPELFVYARCSCFSVINLCRVIGFP